jgi:hypothetical protein
MSEAAHPDDLVTLTRVAELTQAQLLRGRLDAEGIECFLPDEQLARRTWNLRGAPGGLRVQVRRADLERAQEILAEPGVSPLEVTGGETRAEPAGLAGGGASREGMGTLPGFPSEVDDGTISDGDRAAHRALRVALVTLLFMGLVHPYSLWLALRALGRADITDWGRRRAGIALIVSLAGCAWLGILGYRLIRLGF